MGIVEVHLHELQIKVSSAINMHILHTVFNLFPVLLARKI